MLFNSFQFILFFIVIVTLYFLTNPKFRWILLLAASYFFYMSWNIKYAVLIFTSTVITYLSGIYIERFKSKIKKQKLVLSVSLITNLLILFIFKYLNFSIDTVNSLFKYINISSIIPNLDLLLPVGISFYTFQALSYSMDVYKGKVKAEKHFGIYALYVSFFPQLVAGPIERSNNLLPQFKKTHTFDEERVIDGMKLILWGTFKKIVVADRIANIVNVVYGNVYEHNSLVLLTTTILFSIQIFCDFSGYSDIAVGVSRIMGYKLMDNFKRPYYSKTISEFWNRWHISLSTWFKDYVYIPMGGNRVHILKKCFNLFVTFLISGLWHGASFNFLIWGGLHGTYIVTENLTSQSRSILAKKLKLENFQRSRMKKVLDVLFVFALVNFAWIFFRANSIDDALFIVGSFKNLFSDIYSYKEAIYTYINIYPSFGRVEFLITILSVVILELFHLIQRHNSIRHILRKRPRWIRLTIYYFLVLWIIFWGSREGSQFVYFQF